MDGQGVGFILLGVAAVITALGGFVTQIRTVNRVSDKVDKIHEEVVTSVAANGNGNGHDGSG